MFPTSLVSPSTELQYIGLRGERTFWADEAVLAGILNVVPERCRASVLKVFKDLSTGMGGSSKTSWSTIIGLPKQLQDDLQQICIPGESQRPNLPCLLSLVRLD